ncbi:IS1595 family transposase [Candidatus Saccharibacteria bacterium]|nr:MAG: IS1595 family transposase [Candidatus Saccharibacteria bacterium]QQS69605.1 MAG: IS1595 family transposase [Candidatus Saccharibacteria bacterium]
MSKLPKFSSNKKYWMYLNRLVFGQRCHCPRCDEVLQEKYVRGYLWCAVCRHKYRATAWQGSWLYGMKLKPKQLFVLLWCWQQKKGPEVATLLAQVSYTTVARWYERFRTQIPDTAPLLTHLVQVDESYFGKLKSKQPQRIVVGAIEPHTRKLALRITDSRGKEALERFVQDYVVHGSLVISDKWWAYEELPLLGYLHESRNHSKGDYASTNQGENIWSISKRHARKLYGGRILTRRLEALCREWMARHNQPWLFENPTNFLQATLVPC